LYVVNRGPETAGFWVCPKCGRRLKKRDEKHHRPDWTGGECNGRPTDVTLLLHGFQSDVMLAAIDLPSSMVANPRTASGRAAWLSFGTALLHAAATHLQINADELATGMRPWMTSDGRLLGEVYLYDTLPNGAGYADEIAKEIGTILERARDICEHCPTDCETACYQCLLDYGNQRYHPQLDRFLARDLIRYALDGATPVPDEARLAKALRHLSPFASAGYELTFDVTEDGVSMPSVLFMPNADAPASIWPFHSLVGTDASLATKLAIDTGTTPIFVREFDLIRRPFWVWNEILDGKRGMIE